ncbi:MAG: methyltransferase domain-containing protein [Chitinophagaceae bacterium]
MKIRNPRNRESLNIKSTDRVLEVGGGHNPHPRSNVVVDKFTDTNYHRSGDIKVLKNQTFMQADGENLPFKDNEFDYVICCQVLEHVENPEKFLAEQFRVAKRGFMETPSLLGEYLFPRESHKWIIHEMNGITYLVDKSKINFVYGFDMGELIQDYLPTHSIGFKILEKTHPNLITNRVEWEGDFQYVVNPEDPEILKYFTGKWKKEWADAFFPEKTKWEEFKDSSRAFYEMSRSVIRSKGYK